MKIVIIEDEQPAIDKIKSYIERYDASIEVLAVLKTVHESIQWFSNAPQSFDLLISDIQLPDGLSFDIFKHHTITVPVIFTTAFNQYAIDAFKVNSIDYLLKPLQYEAFYQSMEKLKSLKETILGNKERIQYEELNEIISSLKRNYKTRFMVKVGSHIRSVPTDKIALFYADGRSVSLLTFQGREFVIDYKMEELADMLDPSQFFRLNRGALVHIDAITDVAQYSNSRLQIHIEPNFVNELIVSREKVADFKYWFNGEI